jgi:hypothetical protein
MSAHEKWTPDSAVNDDVDFGLSALILKVGHSFYGLYMHGPFSNAEANMGRMALTVSLTTFASDQDMHKTENIGSLGQIEMPYNGTVRHYYEVSCATNLSGRNAIKLVLHCQNSQTFEV